MMKKWLLVLFAWLSFATHVFAVELNTASQSDLEALKGIGPVKSKAIIDERTKNGPFKDADDFATRVKGVGDKTVVSLESQGLTINGSKAAPTGAPAKSAAAGGSMKMSPGANVKSAPAAAPAPAAASSSAMMMAASSADGASSATGKKSKKASKKAAASAASAASASK